MRYVLFMKEECPYCVKARQLLEEKDQNFKIVSFEPDQESVLTEIKDAYDWPTVPMIFQIDDDKKINFIGGYSDLVEHAS
tara:strand:+ start:353 stop:592 length:240 start_codon:yes stop_codon:yes gene_type:complete